MQSRSTVRTNIVIFTILGFVVALLIHFIVLSSPGYDWLNEEGPSAGLLQHLSAAIVYLRAWF